MYIEIGAFDAKAKLSQLLQEVKQGRRYTITLRGQPIADLIPSESAPFPDVHASIDKMRSIRKVKSVSEKVLVKWVAEGRK